MINHNYKILDFLYGNFYNTGEYEKKEIDLYDEVCIQHRKTGYFKWFHLG